MAKRKHAKNEITKQEEKGDEFPLTTMNDDENDLSDSEESEYSGLEDEEEESDDSEVDEIDEDEQQDESDDRNQEEDETDNEDVDDEIVSKENNRKGSGNNSKPKTILFDDADTSDEEDIRNTVGNVPMEWYKDYLHIGYDLSGEKIHKKLQGDELDQFLSKMEDPDYWRTVHDKVNMEDIKLTDEEIEIIQRIQGGQYADKSVDPYEPYVDYFTGDTMIHPIKDNPASKSSFVPSKWEHKRVMKIVRAIRNGWIKPKEKKDGKQKFYMLWGQGDKTNDHPMRWPAPKMKLPGHEESYNPPPEYLPTEDEKASWEAKDPEDRPQNFLPQKFNSLRQVPGYSNFIQERFERCLDLYLCPRQRKIRLNVDPDDLLPKLPRPRDLQPFPTTEGIVYRGHTDGVRSISCDPSGQWLASGGSDKTIRLWEVITGRCMKIIKVNGTVNSIEWNPLDTVPILAAAVGNQLQIINPGLGDKLLCKNVDNQFKSVEKSADDSESLVVWLKPEKEKEENGLRLIVQHTKDIRQVTWHAKGDYIATLMPEETKPTFIHQLSKQKSQCPFQKSKGQIQAIRFHPTRPFFFVATQRYVRAYNLQKQELTKKLVSGVKWISSLDVHPKGDNLIIGSYDKRLCWFDMDLSSKPYKVLRNHNKALRAVRFHRQYPLFASASDDGNVIVCHGTVYSDLMQNPLIVPLKILRGHKIVDDLGVVDCQFHPKQPWIFTCGADSTVRLFT